MRPDKGDRFRAALHPSSGGEGVKLSAAPTDDCSAAAAEVRSLKSSDDPDPAGTNILLFNATFLRKFGLKWLFFLCLKFRLKNPHI